MTHDEKVRQLAASIRARAAEKGAPPAFQKASTPHLVPNPYARKNSRPTVNVAALDELLTIDAKKRIAVAESGLKSGDDLRRLADLRYDAFLIGERFMTSVDPGTALAGLLADARRRDGLPPAREGRTQA